MALAETGALAPVVAFGLIGAIGVGSQWLAWRLRLPAIVLMLAGGILVGPVFGLLDPSRDIGVLVGPMVSIAVAIILFEGGLTLNLHTLRDAAEGVKRLVFLGAPLGWLMSALALRYGAGLSWESSAVFGGIMIVTGPTVIAPLLRQARLAKRPAALLQWEAIINDPIGALAAVLAFEVVLVLRTAETIGAAAADLAIGIAVASALGALGGIGLSFAFRRGHVPEYMKVPVVFSALLAIFALADSLLHESGLLAVTIMGVVIANANLPSYVELRRFKEHATVLLVSGVFVILAASIDFATLEMLNWRAAVFVALVVLVARPLTVLLSLVNTGLPWSERLLIALTGPRGIVLVAVAGLFGARLADLGVEDGALVAPLAFALVAATVLLHGFTLAPFARALGLAGSDAPGVLLVGGSPGMTAFAAALRKAEVPALISDMNRFNLRSAREAGIPVFYGDILSEAAEQNVELVSYAVLVAATSNDAYNTLVATDLAPEFGRTNVYQVARQNGESARRSLPETLGGRTFGANETYRELHEKISAGWSFGITRLTEEFGLEDWRGKNPDAVILGRVGPKGEVRLERDEEVKKVAAGSRLISMMPPAAEAGEGAAAAQSRPPPAGIFTDK